MSKEIKKLILIAALWILLKIIEYYMPIFIAVLSWLGLSVIFLIITIVQLINLIVERKSIRVIKTLFYGLIFYLTLNRFPVDNIIEKADWHILYRKRMEIVEKVQNKELNPNVSWNGWICELPFEFPIVSNGGNDIGIERNDSTQAVTIEFFISRGFLDNPSHYFIYTNDDKNIIYLDSIIKYSEHSWKIKDNWYRIMKR